LISSRRSATGTAERVDQTETYVILVVRKYLLTWGYVKVDPAAF
jgi:hypothetical protein